MARFYVYALLEPGTDQIRYIGKTSSPAKRLASHLSRSSAPNVRAWIASVGRPELRILAEFENETEALLAEQELIGKRRATCELLNLAVRDNRGPAQSSLFSGFGGRVSPGMQIEHAHAVKCGLITIDLSSYNEPSEVAESEIDLVEAALDDLAGAA